MISRSVLTECLWLQKKEGDATPALTRNDYMISFHFLNYGPGQSEADPSVFPESAFSSVHEGFLTADCTVSGATFQLYARGVSQKYKLTIDGKVVLTSDPEVAAVPVDVVQGKKMAFKFEYTQGDNTGQHPSWSLQWVRTQAICVACDVWDDVSDRLLVVFSRCKAATRCKTRWMP